MSLHKNLMPNEVKFSLRSGCYLRTERVLRLWRRRVLLTLGANLKAAPLPPDTIWVARQNP